MSGIFSILPSPRITLDTDPPATAGEQSHQGPGRNLPEYPSEYDGICPHRAPAVLSLTHILFGQMGALIRDIEADAPVGALVWHGRV